MLNQIIKFTVKSDYKDAFQAALLEAKKGTQQETGNVEVKQFVDNNNPNVFFEYMRWEDQAAIEHHQTQDYVTNIMNLAQDALECPPTILNLGETKPAPVPLKKANPEDDVFIIFFIFKFKDGMRQKLLDRFEDHIENTRKEKGNLLFDLFTVNGDENTLAVYEHWRKESDVWDIHFKQPYAEITGALMHEAVIGDMEQYMNFVTEIN